MSTPSFEQDTTSTYTAILKDSLGVVIGVSAISAFTATLTEKESGSVINSRDNVDLRVGGAWTDVNGMQAVIDANGNLKLHLSEVDNAITVTGATGGEVHVITIYITASGSDARTLKRKREYEYHIERTQHQ